MGAAGKLLWAQLKAEPTTPLEAGLEAQGRVKARIACDPDEML